MQVVSELQSEFDPFSVQIAEGDRILLDFNLLVATGGGTPAAADTGEAVTFQRRPVILGYQNSEATSN